MKVSVDQLQNSAEALSELAKVQFPAAIAFRIAHVLGAIKGPLEAFSTARASLLRSVGTPDETNPDVFKINDEAKWKEEMTALLAQEVEIAVEDIKIDQLGDAKLEPRVLYQLMWLFKA
jgi:hypothetical protein